MLWEIDIHPATETGDLVDERIRAAAAEFNMAPPERTRSCRGYLLQGDLKREQVSSLAERLFVDAVVENYIAAPTTDPQIVEPPFSNAALVYVLPRPGVTDPAAESAKRAITELGERVEAVRTFRKYWFAGISDEQAQLIARRILANDAIEQIISGPLPFDRLELGTDYTFSLVRVSLRDMDSEALLRFSKHGQLYLSLEEMQAIQRYYSDLGRDPTDAELETIAQTWSEHCSHKTLAGRVAYSGPEGERHFENMLKETIFAATQTIRGQLGNNDDWCVSVFEDNAGIVRFDAEYNLVFKVETHNHPSALEPYGGANTGIGGVIRDPLGTGLGAKPICNTDVFCFAPPDTPIGSLPPGVLHPRRVMEGVVEGVRDYGNRMGIPTVNGAIYFDDRYLGNPLVYCGNVGLIPRDKSRKQPHPGDFIVVAGGRTGRDGIHGATFSSAELTSESEAVSGGAVQIGNAIIEKMLVDVILQARDRGLYSAITDCGAGGLSSAVGEMGAEIGAEVDLERVPLKYSGLSYTEIWISEAQERMVLSVPPNNLQELEVLFNSEGVEATVIGTFVPSERLLLRYEGNIVADLDMHFLHHGRPPVVRQAIYSPKAEKPLGIKTDVDLGPTLLRILGQLNVASKEWVIRQYDHEVQGGSIVKPLVGPHADGPSDAAVVRPIADSYRGVAISCGMNPHYGEFDTYHMAASAIDEAVRNCVAVGADPSKIAILDNFCWGDTSRPEVLGSLVRAALACHDVAIELGTPFISGKDSLNNEFRYEDQHGAKQSISIPPSLLISAMGQIEDIRRCVTMDLKAPGNLLYQVGITRDELGGSHFALVHEFIGGAVPRVSVAEAKAIFQAVHAAMKQGLVRSCHDLSEGGLAAAMAEMAFAGEWGASISLHNVPCVPELAAVSSREPQAAQWALLFSESNSRFLCEVEPRHQQQFETVIAGVPFGKIGEVTESPFFAVHADRDTAGGEDNQLLRISIHELKEAWKRPLSW